MTIPLRWERTDEDTGRIVCPVCAAHLEVQVGGAPTVRCGCREVLDNPWAATLRGTGGTGGTGGA